MKPRVLTIPSGSTTAQYTGIGPGCRPVPGQRAGDPWTHLHQYRPPSALHTPINVGEPTNTTQLLLAQERIDALNVTASTNISRVDSRVLVRITDGQGFVVEPLEFTVSSLINLMLGNLKLVYHNLFGYAINPYINYNLSTDEAYYGIQTPAGYCQFTMIWVIMSTRTPTPQTTKTYGSTRRRVLAGQLHSRPRFGAPVASWSTPTGNHRVRLRPIPIPPGGCMK